MKQFCLRLARLCASASLLTLIILQPASAFNMTGAAGSGESEQTLKGIITDTAGDPLPGATVWIPELQSGTTANQHGHFELPGLQSGSWTLVIRHVGFQTLETNISWPADASEMDDDGHLAFTLEQEVVLTDELLVVGSLFDRITRYQPTQSYTAREVQKRNTASIGTLLDGESGVAMRSMGNAPARPVVRGMDGERIQVLQNGMKMGDFSATGHDHAVIMDPSSLDRVDIVRGPASLIYGSSAMGGIINVHSGDIPSRWADGTSGYLGAEGQSGSSSLNGVTRLTYGLGDRAYTFRSSLRNTGDMQTPEGEIPGTDMRSIDIGAGGAWRYNSGYSGGSIQYSDKTYGIPEDPFDLDEEVELEMQRLAVQGTTHYKLDHHFWNAAEARMVYNYYTHEEIEYKYADGVLDDVDLELAVDHHFFQTDVLFQHGERGAIDNGTAGITFEWRDVSVGGEEALTPDARGWTTAGFIVEELRLPRNWRLQSGLRLEWNYIRSLSNEDFPEAGTTRSQGIWAGSIGASGPLSGNLDAGIQFARSHRTPSLEELFADAIHFAAGAYEVGDPDLDDETGYSTDLFLDYRTSGWQLHLALFANRVTNYISLRPTGETEPSRGYPVLEYFSTDAELLGAEFFAKRNLTGQLSISLGGDFIRGSELENGSREPLPFMPPLRTFAETTFDTGTWWASVRVRHVLSQERTAASEEETDGYTLTEASLGARLGSSRIHNITLTAENLFDVTWRDHLSRIEQRDIPMMGRNIRLSYRFYF